MFALGSQVTIKLAQVALHAAALSQEQEAIALPVTVLRPLPAMIIGAAVLSLPPSTHMLSKESI